MLITCYNCNKKFKIPEDKIPSNVSKFAVKCPSCGEKIIVKKEKKVPKKVILQTQKKIEPEMFPPASKVAFLFVDNEKIVEVVKFFLEKRVPKYFNKFLMGLK